MEAAATLGCTRNGGSRALRSALCGGSRNEWYLQRCSAQQSPQCRAQSWFVVSSACVCVLIPCGVRCAHIVSRVAISLRMTGTDGYRTQKQMAVQKEEDGKRRKRKGWMSGQLRAEKLLAEAGAIDGRKECTQNTSPHICLTLVSLRSVLHYVTLFHMHMRACGSSLSWSSRTR